MKTFRRQQVWEESLQATNALSWTPTLSYATKCCRMLLKSFKALHLNEVGIIYKAAHLWKYGTSQHGSRCGIFLLNCCDITWFNTSHVLHLSCQTNWCLEFECLGIWNVSTNPFHQLHICWILSGTCVYPVLLMESFSLSFPMLNIQFITFKSHWR